MGSKQKLLAPPGVRGLGPSKCHFGARDEKKKVLTKIFFLIFLSRAVLFLGRAQTRTPGRHASAGPAMATKAAHSPTDPQPEVDKGRGQRPQKNNDQKNNNKKNYIWLKDIYI